MRHMYTEPNILWDKNKVCDRRSWTCIIQKTLGKNLCVTTTASTTYFVEHWQTSVYLNIRHKTATSFPQLSRKWTKLSGSICQHDSKVKFPLHRLSGFRQINEGGGCNYVLTLLKHMLLVFIWRRWEICFVQFITMKYVSSLYLQYIKPVTCKFVG